MQSHLLERSTSRLSPRIALVGLLVSLLGSSAASSQPMLNGCPVLPANNIWNVRVDDLPVHPQSSQWVQTIGSQTPIHPDFGSGDYPQGSGSPIGIPYVVVPSGQPRVPISFLYDDESDPGPYPIPPSPPIEGGENGDGDRHILVFQQGRCELFEVFDAQPQNGGSWFGGSGAFFDLESNALRPAGWTSADAAGLPIFPGLVRWDEVEGGEIQHALRFTVPQTRREYVWPARHFASSLTGVQYPPMGVRFRLKSSFDVSSYSPRIRVILRALKRYGMMLADNGSPWFLSGVPDERWDNDELRDLKTLRGSDFEAVNVTSLMVSPNSGQTTAGGGNDPPPPPPQPPAPFTCVENDQTLCLNEERFEVTVSWRDFIDRQGVGTKVDSRTDDSGLFWFFNAENWELLVKVIDGCGNNNHYWVFAAATTNVEYLLRVRDSTTGESVSYPNPLGRSSPAITDTAAFASCP